MIKPNEYELLDPEAAAPALERRQPNQRKAETRPGERRRHARRSVVLIVDVHAGPWSTVGVVTDLSEGGALLTMVQQPALGARLQLSVVVEHRHPRLELSAEVRRFAHGAVGVEFVELSDTLVELLDAVLAPL